MVGKRAGQAAMEYLMTYGWALLVIVIVIAILLVMNPFSAPQSCRFDQVGYTCDSPAIDTSGLLYVKILNGNNNGVSVLGVACTTSKASTPPTYTAYGTPQHVARQDTLQIDKVTNKVTCTDASGGSLTLAKGNDFSGKIWVFYRNDEDGSNYPVRSASANIVTKVAG
jgi:hypothetical protein